LHFEDKLSGEMQVVSGLRKSPCVMLFARLSDRGVTLIFFPNAVAAKQQQQQQQQYEVSP